MMSTPQEQKAEDRRLAHSVALKTLGDECNPERYERAFAVALAAIARCRADADRERADRVVLEFRRAAGVPMAGACCCVGCPHDRHCRCMCPVCVAEMVLGLGPFAGDRAAALAARVRSLTAEERERFRAVLDGEPTSFSEIIRGHQEATARLGLLKKEMGLGGIGD